MGTLEERWRQLCGQLQIQKEHTDRWWTVICDYYNEPQRYYHTLEHITSMFEQMEAHCNGKIKNMLEVQLAVYFHEELHNISLHSAYFIIYDPKSKDNEKESAELVVKFINETVPSSMVSSGIINPQSIHHMILLTETHRTPAHSTANEFGSDDIHYMLDLDMSILGQSWTIYKRYAGYIRNEYSHIPHSDYCQKRAKVLTNFLLTDRIYCTSEFYSIYEESARNNIQKEIELLNKDIVP